MKTISQAQFEELIRVALNLDDEDVEVAGNIFRTQLTEILDGLEMEEKDIPTRFEMEKMQLTETALDASIRAIELRSYNQAIQEFNEKLKEVRG